MLSRPCPLGLAVALVFAWQSLSPTLMPRTWLAQAAITGICFALGYGIGALVERVVVPVLAWRRRSFSPRAVTIVWWALAAAAALVLLLVVTAWPAWQNDQRELLGMSRLSWLLGVPVIMVAAAVAALLGLFGRAIGRLVTRLHRFMNRRLPRAAATPLTILLVVVLFGVVVRDAATSRFVSWANSAFGTVDTSTEDGVVQPTVETVSGGPSSLAAWDTLGRQGRSFVAGVTSRPELEAFHGASADLIDPIRVYTGIRSAESVVARADLAVAELERTGAFDRDVVVVATSTGTGWIDPDAARALEMLHAGDTAIVSMQYSYLPSWISTLVDVGNATEAGAVLFDAVHEAWSDLPEDDRPALLVFGLSLGSYGAEAAFAGPEASTSVANLVARTDGALLVGPTNDNVIWRQLTAAREPGSPAWRPVIDGGRTVRFFNTADELADLDPTWQGPRVVYVQHPSDPVTFWTMDTWRSAPEWMARPRGYDVPGRGSWFPVVTWVQGVFDLMAGFGAPPGHGHDYRLAYVGAWSQVLAPEGWGEAELVRLADHLLPD